MLTYENGTCAIDEESDGDEMAASLVVDRARLMLRCGRVTAYGVTLEDPGRFWRRISRAKCNRTLPKGEFTLDDTHLFSIREKSVRICSGDGALASAGGPGPDCADSSADSSAMISLAVFKKVAALVYEWGRDNGLYERRQPRRRRRRR